MNQEFQLFFRGLVLGLSIAAPVGPIGVLTIRRTLDGGFWRGWVTGLGAATADVFYGALAAGGLSVFSALLLSAQVWLRWVGGAFLLFLGLRTFFERPAVQAASVRTGGALGDYGSALGLTLTNPITIFSFLGIFAGLGVGSTSGKFDQAVWVVMGVFFGSILWWIILSGGVSLLRVRVNARWMMWVNRLAGVIIFGFGLAALWPKGL